MKRLEGREIDELYERLIKTYREAGKDPQSPRTEIPNRHYHAILWENWSDAQEVIEKHGVLVGATTFKMDSKDRRLEVLAGGKPAAVIVGSFRFKEEIDRVIDEFESKGVQILMPPRGVVAEKVGDFPLLVGDNPNIPTTVIEDFFIQNLQAADFGYIVNPNGYIGDMSTIEIGLAMKKGVPLYSKEPIDMDRVPDYSWKPTIGLIKPFIVDDVVRMADSDSYDTDEYPWYRPLNIIGTHRPAPDLDLMALREIGISI